MKSVYTARIRKDNSCWVGWVEEPPGVNSQGSTKGELMRNLRSALREVLEMNRAEAHALTSPEHEEATIVIELETAESQADGKEASPTKDPIAYLMDIYDRHVRHLEGQHWGKFVTVASDGEIFMADTYEESWKMAKSRGKDDGCSFKVGDISVETLRL